MNATIKTDSFVTLHYRLATADGLEVANTFGASPATLQFGSGQLAPTLEERLIHMAEGERRTFELEPGTAFGPRNAELVRRIARADLPPKSVAERGNQIDFAAPDGHTFSGLVLEANEHSVLLDFNHPLAGKHIHFEVQIVGVL